MIRCGKANEIYICKLVVFVTVISKRIGLYVHNIISWAVMEFLQISKYHQDICWTLSKNNSFILNIVSHASYKRILQEISSKKVSYLPKNCFEFNCSSRVPTRLLIWIIRVLLDFRMEFLPRSLKNRRPKSSSEDPCIYSNLLALRRMYAVKFCIIIAAL